MPPLALLVSVASLVCAHAADAGGPEPVNGVMLAVGMAAIIIVGVGLTIAGTPEDSRGLGKLLTVKTSKGIESLPNVIIPNLIPAFTVTLVAVPLSLALGIASGTSPMAAIATAVVAGLVHGTFGDSAFNIMGPAGAMVGVLLRFTTKYGPEVVPWLSLISAALITLALVLRLHEYCMFMPKAVFEGFTASVALTIGLSQADFAFGLTSGPPLKIAGLELSPAVWKLAASIKAFGTLQAPSTVFTVVGFLTMYFLFKVKPTIPWMVPFAVVSCIIGAMCDEDALGIIPLELPNLKSKYGVLSFWLAQPLKPLGQIIAAAEDGKGSYGDIFQGALSVTIVAVLNTLISAQIAKNRSKMPYSDVRELQGLALTHAACGICGLMPTTGVFVTTSVNLSTGATHRASQFIYGICVLLFASVVMPVLAYIPQGAIAAILLISAFRMMPWGYIQKLWEDQKWYFGLLCVVALVCFCIDSVTGLAVGTMAALLVTGKETASGHAELSITASGNKLLEDGSPKMISIDALAVDNVDLAPRLEEEEDSESESETFSQQSELPSMQDRADYMESRRETAAFSRLTSGEHSHSHMAYAPEFDHIKECSEGDAFDRHSSNFDRQVSGTRGLFMDENTESLQPTMRGDRVFLYKFFGQLDFLAGDRHVDRFQAILASGPKAVVIAMQNVPWVDPDGMEALRDIITMLDENMVKVYLACPRPKVAETLENEEWYQEKIAGCQRVFPTEKAALIAAVGASKDLEIGGGGLSHHDASLGA